MFMTACTVITTATGGTCGAPAVHVFKATNGATYAECAAHNTGTIGAGRAGHEVGDTVEINRYGKTYTAVITRVGAKGAAYATFTYDNGATRTVRVWAVRV